MRVAIVHYWLVGMRGGERVVESLLELYPQADIFTLVQANDGVSPRIRERVVKESFIGRLPFASRLYQAYLPLMPLALEQFDLRGYDLVISSESGPAKGVVVDPDALHICYCHSPMRYVWDMYFEYKDRASIIKRLVMPLFMHYLRLWDVTTSHRVSYFIANSSYVARRIRQYYNRDSSIIFPPVSIADFTVSDDKEDFYLLVGELVPYKRADLAVQAFVASGRRLKVVGSGEQFNSLCAIATSNVEMVGKVGFEELKSLYSRARALVFPGVEDFGMVPVEAMASGTPVIAYGRGGALDTVVDGISGLLFYEQTIESLNDAVARFEAMPEKFDAQQLREHSQTFDKHRFMVEIAGFVEQSMAKN